MTRQPVERSVVPKMRTPIRSELEAFRPVTAGALVVGAAVFIGLLTEAVVGIGVFAVPTK